MKKLFTLILLTVFFFQSCKKEFEKEEITSIIDTAKTSIINESELSINTTQKYELPFDIEGKYIFEDDVAKCRMELSLFYENGQLKYKMQTNTRKLFGNAKILKEEKKNYIVFQNIKWSENLGYIDPEGSTPEEKLPLPTEIFASIDDKEIVFQNYGNAENYFVIIKECDTKYIILEKQTNQQLGEDIPKINAYAKNIYKKDGRIYIDLDLVEIRYPTKGDWDVSDREIVNNNPKIRTYIIDDYSNILSDTCKDLTATELFELRKSVLIDKNIFVIGSSKNGKILEISFGCFE